MTYQPPIEITAWQKDPSIAAVVRATFPTYRRKKVYIKASETVSLQDLNWSGGTRSEYHACTIDGTPTGSSDKYSAYHPFDNPAEGKEIPIPTGIVVVRGGFFCGKQSALTLHVNPADMPKYLNAGSTGG
jgi:hypothetical protein